ncbi:hypothetical protein BC826DRAFT_927679 [Russula brevipes]|nr:hypothetical protein BC826DRAFT_927679 [Russula brevipes]
MRTLDSDLVEKKLSERVVHYSHKLFRQVAVEWLVATDQPIQALQHPKFRELITSLLVPQRGQHSRAEGHAAEIMRLFKEHLTKLKAQLNVRI